MQPEVIDSVKKIEAAGQTENPRYMQLLQGFYDKHLCRIVPNPDPVQRAFKHVNYTIYKMMQGPSEFGASGRLEFWDIKKRLPEIKVPTLTVGAKFDTMESMLTFDTRQGQLRMNKRNPIPATLSEDLANPSDPSRVARFDTWHEMPNWANPAQVRQAEALLESDTDPENRMRRHYGVDLFNRAPGQSFRYGTTN